MHRQTAISHQDDDLPTEPDQGGRRDSKTRLLHAAEQLVVDNGLGSTSARQIAAAAGQKNTSAVRYHFGSLERLYEDLLLHRMRQMEEPRRLLLDHALAQGAETDLRTLLDITFLPHLDLTDEHGRRPYAHFLTAYLTRYHPLGIAWTRDVEGLLPVVANVQRLIEQRLSFLPPYVVLRRVTAASITFLNVLIARDYGHFSVQNDEDFEAAIEDTLDHLAAGLATPSQVRRVRFDLFRDGQSRLEP